MRNPTQKFFFPMKGIYKEPGRFWRRNFQPQLLQNQILAQQLKIIKTIPDRDKGLYIIRFLVLAGTPLKYKMFWDGL
ncbi:MAG: hypothetical protein FJ117_00585 [Deltaproteobacteria bacterium]|nr:hypothetical protein [Deltaproteobacteria bacterium]